MKTQPARRRIPLSAALLALAAALLLLLAPAPRAQGTTPQTITWTGTTNDILALHTPYPIGATASSGLPVTLRLLTGPALLENGTLTATNPGTIWLTAEQIGNETHAMAEASRSFNLRTVVLSQVSSFRPAGSARNLQVIGKYAYVASHFAGLQIVDISDPGNLKQVGGYDTSGYSRGIQVLDNLVYLADHDAGLLLFDVSNPSSPALVSRLGTMGLAEGVQVVGNFVYVADNQTGLQVIDISEPALPKRVGRFSTAGSTHGVQVLGNYAYVADGEAGLQVLDISDPAKPARVGSFDTPGSAQNVQVVGNYAHVADDTGGLQVIDVGNPTLPKWVSEFRIRSFIQHVYLTNGYAFLSDLERRVHVIDLSNLAKPTRVGFYPTQSSNFQIQIVGNLAYVAGFDGGLLILGIGFRDPQRMELILTTRIPLRGPPFSRVAQATSGLPIALSVVRGPATVEDSQLRFTGVGFVRLRAEQPGNDDYLPATAEWTITVTPPQLSIRHTAGQPELAWPAGLAGYKLQIADSLDLATPWRDVPATPLETNGEAHLPLDPNAPQAYFRLAKP